MHIPDRQRQRKEYLIKKTGVVSKMIGGGLLLSCLEIATLLSGTFTCIALIFVFCNPTSFWLASTAISALFTIAGGYACPALNRFIEKAEREEAMIAYVPPVMPDSLPAEEVLVRMAQEPLPDQSAILLRSAEAGSTAPVEQLLRAVEGETQERET